METMPLALDWTDIAARLACAFAAGAAFGVNRSESGKAAGLRTTILVGLAACLAMLQANALLDQAGKARDGFATLDVMRLPLGILKRPKKRPKKRHVRCRRQPQAAHARIVVETWAVRMSAPVAVDGEERTCEVPDVIATISGRVPRGRPR